MAFRAGISSSMPFFLYLFSVVLTVQSVPAVAFADSSLAASPSPQYQLGSSTRQLQNASKQAPPARKPAQPLLSPADAAAAPDRATPDQAPSSNRSSSNSSSSAAQSFCKWDASNSTCNIAAKAWLSAGPGMPSSPYRKAVLMALGREKHCARYTAQAACMKDLSRRCFWQASRDEPGTGKCTSSDMEEILLFSSKGFKPSVPVIPHSLTCPGTAAHSFYECYAHVGKLEACKLMPQCTWLASLGTVSNICVPKSFEQQTFKAVRQLLTALEQLSSSAYGECEAACWLQQAFICSNSTEQTCRQLPFCTVVGGSSRSNSLLSGGSSGSDSDDSGSEDDGNLGGRLVAAKSVKASACRRNILEFSSKNALDMAAQKIHKQCQSLTAEDACSSAVVTTAPQAPAAAAAIKAPVMIWENYQPPSAAVQCRLATKAVAGLHL